MLHTMEQNLCIAGLLEVIFHPSRNQFALHASRSFEKGEIITPFSHEEELTEPNQLSLQLNERTHIALLPHCLRYTNHSCAPNVFFDTKKKQLLALVHVETNDELCFFYPSTEWLMATPFDCTCGSDSCLRVIAGASALSEEQRARYLLNQHIHHLLDKKK